MVSFNHLLLLGFSLATASPLQYTHDIWKALRIAATPNSMKQEDPPFHSQDDFSILLLNIQEIGYDLGDLAYSVALFDGTLNAIDDLKDNLTRAVFQLYLTETDAEELQSRQPLNEPQSGRLAQAYEALGHPLGTATNAYVNALGRFNATGTQQIARDQLYELQTEINNLGLQFESMMPIPSLRELVTSITASYDNSIRDVRAHFEELATVRQGRLSKQEDFRCKDSL